MSWRAHYLDADAAFLKSCAPDVRKQHGVYFTPAAIVRAQVRLVDEVLRERLGCADGFADQRVLTVDPACGGGAYPLAILDLAGTARMQLFETLPRAAALSRARGLRVTESDALTRTRPFAAPVVVCIGNPPYRRARKRDADLVHGFTQQVQPVHLKNLYNEYVYFWRWALRVALEERSGPAVVCFLTAASYLQGPAFVGMRHHLLRAFDEWWVVDLEGDQRAARRSNNVFPIRTPVAIGLGVRYGDHSSPAPATQHYTRLRGSAQEKLGSLEHIQGLQDLTPPTSKRSEYSTWPALTDLFPWHTSGAQLKRTWPIGVTTDVLQRRWRALLELPSSKRLAAFGPTRDRDLHSAPPDVEDGTQLRPLEDLTPETVCPEPVRYAYRAFDRRWVLADARLGDFLRPRLWRAHGNQQIYLTTMLTNVLGPGPAAIATALVPDLDQFRGSFGAQGVIPLWLDSVAARPNVSTAWLSRLSDTYGFAVPAPDLMAYCYALLAGRGYVRHFEEDLRTPGPRIPLTLDAALFRRGVALGAELLRVHTYRAIGEGTATLMRTIGPSFPTGFAYADETLRVGIGDVGPVSRAVWDYSVSGYRVLPSWLRRRLVARGKSPLDHIAPRDWAPALTRELLELIWLLEATIAIEPDLNELLAAVISSGCAQAGAQQQLAHGLGSQRTREDEALPVIAP